MSWTLHLRKTLNLAIPLALGQLMSIGINTADIIAMGQLGTRELAAGSLATRYFQPFFFMGMGLMLAVGPLVAQGLGGNDDRLVQCVSTGPISGGCCWSGVYSDCRRAHSADLAWSRPRHLGSMWMNFCSGWPLAFPLSLFILLPGNMSFRINGQFHKLWQLPWVGRKYHCQSFADQWHRPFPAMGVEWDCAVNKCDLSVDGWRFADLYWP